MVNNGVLEELYTLNIKKFNIRKNIYNNNIKYII